MDPNSEAKTNVNIIQQNILKQRVLLILAGVTVVILLIIVGIILLGNLAKPTIEEPGASDNNTLTGDDECQTTSTLADALANPGIVCVLDLTDQGLAEIPVEVGTLPNLKRLILTGNPISEENKTAISEALRNRNPQPGYDIQF